MGFTAVLLIYSVSHSTVYHCFINESKPASHKDTVLLYHLYQCYHYKITNVSAAWFS